MGGVVSERSRDVSHDEPLVHGAAPEDKGQDKRDRVTCPAGCWRAWHSKPVGGEETDETDRNDRQVACSHVHDERSQHSRCRREDRQAHPVLGPAILERKTVEGSCREEQHESIQSAHVGCVA